MIVINLQEPLSSLFPLAVETLSGLKMHLLLRFLWLGNSPGSVATLSLELAHAGLISPLYSLFSHNRILTLCTSFFVIKQPWPDILILFL